MNILIKALERLGSKPTFHNKTLKRKLAFMLRLGVNKQLITAVANKSHNNIARLANIKSYQCCFIMLPKGKRGALESTFSKYLERKNTFFKLAV